MLWQRTTKKDSTQWVAVDSEGKQVQGEDGKYMTRYSDRRGAPIYKSEHKVRVDKTSAPVELPDGVDRYSEEGIVAAFLLSDEAKKDWAFLDAWKRRRFKQVVHAGCGDSWPEVSETVPITCPTCGVLPKDATLYIRFDTQRESEGEGVRVIVYEAWLTGRYEHYRPGRASSQTVRAGRPKASPRSDLRAAPASQKTVSLTPAKTTNMGVVVVLAVVILTALAVLVYRVAT